MMPATDLPKDYYLQNFRQLTELVHHQYADLLSTDESEWLNAFLEAPRDAQKLYVRLLMRKGPLFRLDKLHYEEISDITGSANSLAAKKLIEHVPATIAHCCGLMTKPELVKAFPGLTPSMSKTAITDKLKSESGETLVDSSPITVIRVLGKEHLRTFLLLYFGNTHQDLAQFVISDLGIQRFEDYPIDKAFRLFSCREDIENWLHLSSLREQIYEAQERKDRQGVIALAEELPTSFSWPLLERKRMRLINHIAREMEREKRDSEALALYRQSNITPSRERQVRLLIKTAQFDEAETLVKTMLAEPEDEQEAHIALKLAKQVSRKTNWDWVPPPQFHPKELFLELKKGEKRVEIDVLDHFADLGWNVYYTENVLIPAVFGLFFWDTIYSPVQGAFLNPFQLGPRDAFSKEFYTHRKSAIDEKIKNIHSIFSDIYIYYDKKSGINNFWVNWNAIDKEVIKGLENAINISQLTEIFNKLLFDPKLNRSGFPDLFLLNENDYLFLEVKGPGDSLRDNQLRWLETFDKVGIKSAICWVKYTC